MPDHAHQGAHGDSDASRELSNLSIPANKKTLDKLFKSAKNKEIAEKYAGLDTLREGNRYNVLISLIGYIAWANPRLTGVVELLNSMVAEPFDYGESTLCGLVGYYETCREKGWRENGESIMAYEAKQKRRKNLDDDSPGLERGEYGGIILPGFTGDTVPDDFIPPEIMSIQEINQTKEIRLNVRWQPQDNHPSWDDEGADREAGFVDTQIMFPRFTSLSRYATAQAIIQDHFSLVLNVEKPKLWPFFIDALVRSSGLYEFVDESPDESVVIATSLFIKVLSHMTLSAKSESNILDKQSRFLTSSIIKGEKFYAFKNPNDALLQFTSSILASADSRLGAELRKFIQGEYKRTVIKKAFIDSLKSLGLDQRTLHFKNGKRDGSPGKCRCWVFSPTMLDPHKELKDNYFDHDDTGNPIPPDKDCSEEKKAVYDEAMYSPEPGDSLDEKPIDPDLEDRAF